MLMDTVRQNRISGFSKPVPNVVLYHADCMDGFGAAWALWKRFPKAEYIPVKHGQPPPSSFDNKHVLMVDFSYERKVIEEINRAAASFQLSLIHI